LRSPSRPSPWLPSGCSWREKICGRGWFAVVQPRRKDLGRTRREEAISRTRVEVFEPYFLQEHDRPEIHRTQCLPIGRGSKKEWRRPEDGLQNQGRRNVSHYNGTKLWRKESYGTIGEEDWSQIDFELQWPG